VIEQYLPNKAKTCFSTFFFFAISVSLNTTAGGTISTRRCGRPPREAKLQAQHSAPDPITVMPELGQGIDAGK
jgi:hypothetical protein